LTPEVDHLPDFYVALLAVARTTASG